MFEHNLEELYKYALVLAGVAQARITNFKVGAVAVCEDQVFEGFNIESGTLTLSMHAEHSALIHALLHRAGIPTMIVVAKWDGGDLFPCGHCLQSMHEVGVRFVVFKQGGKLVKIPMEELLPCAFSFSMGQGDQGDNQSG